MTPLISRYNTELANYVKNITIYEYMMWYDLLDGYRRCVVVVIIVQIEAQPLSARLITALKIWKRCDAEIALLHVWECLLTRGGDTKLNKSGRRVGGFSARQGMYKSMHARIQTPRTTRTWVWAYFSYCQLWLRFHPVTE